MSDEKDAGIEIGLSGGGWLTYRGEYGEGVGWLEMGRVRGVSSEALGGLLEVRMREVGVEGGLAGLPPVLLERPGMLSELKSAVCDAGKLAQVWPGGVLLRMGGWERLMTKDDSVADVVREWMSGSGLSGNDGAAVGGSEPDGEWRTVVDVVTGEDLYREYFRTADGVQGCDATVVEGAEARPLAPLEVSVALVERALTEAQERGALNSWEYWSSECGHHRYSCWRGAGTQKYIERESVARCTAAAALALAVQDAKKAEAAEREAAASCEEAVAVPVLSEREAAVLESVGLTFGEAQVLMERVVDAYREMGAAFRDATAAFVEAARGFLVEEAAAVPEGPEDPLAVPMGEATGGGVPLC